MGAYLRKVWLGFYTVLLGLKVTWKYLVSKPITLQYPDEKWDIPDGSRGKLDTEIEDCIGCLACARACPVDCITITTKKPPKGLDLGATSGGTKKKLVVPQFDIDISICLYCGLCVESCPTGCIRMTKDYEYSTYDRRKDLLLHFGKDLDPEVEAAAIKRAKEIEEAEKAEAAKKDEAAKKTEAGEKAGAKQKAGAAKSAEDAEKGVPTDRVGAAGRTGDAKALAGEKAGSEAKSDPAAAKPKPDSKNSDSDKPVKPGAAGGGPGGDGVEKSAAPTMKAGPPGEPQKKRSPPEDS